MSHVIILAGSAKEGNAYRRDADVPRGRTIVALSATQIDGVVPSEIHVLPGFLKRRDVHSINAAIKRASRRYQDIKWVDLTDPRGPLTERQLEVAYRYDTLRDIAALDAVAEGSKEQALEETLDLLDQHDEVLEKMAAVADTPAVTEATEARQDHNDLAREALGAEPRKRRSKCADCQTLHFKGEACPPPAPSEFFDV